MDFLFLSKLLPLFFYPVGLVSLLLIFSLILWWKYPRWLPFPLILAFLILFFSGNSLVSKFLIKSLEWQYIVSPSQIPNAEAIVILGGAIRPKIDPRPMVEVTEGGDRIIYGAQLYKMGKAPIIIASGGRIQWQNSNNNFSEADDIEKLLLLFDIPQDSIVKEGHSYNTYDNAVNTKQILQQLNIDRVILVTSAFHMPRAVKVFRKQGIEVIPAPTDYLVSQEQAEKNLNWQNAVLQLIPNSSSVDKTTLALKEYIGLVVYKFKGWV